MNGVDVFGTDLINDMYWAEMSHMYFRKAEGKILIQQACVCLQNKTQLQTQNRIVRTILTTPFWARWFSGTRYVMFVMIWLLYWYFDYFFYYNINNLILTIIVSLVSKAGQWIFRIVSLLGNLFAQNTYVTHGPGCLHLPKVLC